MNSKNPFTNGKVVGANIRPDDYRKQDAPRGHPEHFLTRSSLMMFRSCPAKWKAGWESKETDATEWGSLMDCLILTPNRFAVDYAVEPETVIATKKMGCVKSGEYKAGDEVPYNPLCAEAKEWKREQVKANRIILSRKDMDEADQAKAILLGDERISGVVESSERQVMVVGEYHDPETKLVVPVRTLIDLVPMKDSRFHSDLADFKTARSAHPRTWEREADMRDYDAQAAMSLDLFNVATGEERISFLHVIQENTHPWQPARRLFEQELIELGRLKITSALAFYCRCLKDNRWPDWDDDSEFNGWGLIKAGPWHSMFRS